MSRRMDFIVTVVIVSLIILSLGVKLHSDFFHSHLDSDRNFQQINNIVKNKNYFSFAVFGDNKNSTRVFEQIINRINKGRYLFSIDDGDLVYDGELQKYRFFLDQIKDIKIPFLTVVGNHEIKESGRANYYDIFGRFYYSFAVGENYFIILDDANEVSVDPWQLKWLEDELIRSQKYRYRFVFMHVPLFDPREGVRTQGHSLKDFKNAMYLNSLFDKYNVTMVFASHIHGYFTGKWGSTPFIITGGAGAELLGTDKKHYFYHYIDVKISKKGVSYSVVHLKTPNSFYSILFHDLWIYFYSFIVIHFWDIILILSLVYLVFVHKRWLVFNVKRKN